MAREMMFGEAIATAIIEEMQRDSDVVFYGQNIGDDRARSHAQKIRQKPRPHHPDFGDGGTRRRRRRGRMPDLRPIVEL